MQGWDSSTLTQRKFTIYMNIFLANTNKPVVEVTRNHLLQEDILLQISGILSQSRELVVQFDRLTNQAGRTINPTLRDVIVRRFLTSPLLSLNVLQFHKHPSPLRYTDTQQRGVILNNTNIRLQNIRLPPLYCVALSRSGEAGQLKNVPLNQTNRG